MKPLLLIFFGLAVFFASAQNFSENSNSSFISNQTDSDAVKINYGIALGNNYSYPYSYSSIFEDRFTDWNQNNVYYTGFAISINPKAIPTEYKVKRIVVYDERHNKMKQSDFDFSGKETAAYSLSSFWIKTEQRTEAGKYYEVKGYYDQDTVIRLDSIIRWQQDLNRHDTICTCAYDKIITYKRGSLLNEQNSYFNENFLNKKIEPDPFTVSATDVHGKNVLTGKYVQQVYFSKPFRTNYKRSKLFQTKTVLTCDNRWLKPGQENLKMSDSLIAVTCSACNKYRTTTKFREEEFNEPRIRHEIMSCSLRSTSNVSLMPTPCYMISRNDKNLSEKFFLRSAKLLPDKDGQYLGNWEIVTNETPSFTVEYEFY